MPDLQTTDGIRLAYQLDGMASGEPMVLLHGLGSDAESSQPLVDALARRLAVARLDLRGHGGSEPLVDPRRPGCRGRGRHFALGAAARARWDHRALRQ